jgi:hypothetical protein
MELNTTHVTWPPCAVRRQASGLGGYSPFRTLQNCTEPSWSTHVWTTRSGNESKKNQGRGCWGHRVVGSTVVKHKVAGHFVGKGDWSATLTNLAPNNNVSGRRIVAARGNGQPSSLRVLHSDHLQGTNRRLKLRGHRTTCMQPGGRGRGRGSGEWRVEHLRVLNLLVERSHGVDQVPHPHSTIVAT